MVMVGIAIRDELGANPLTTTAAVPGKKRSLMRMRFPVETTKCCDYSSQ